MDFRHRRIRNIAWRICAAAVLCAAADLTAQTIHKVADATGSFKYTDRMDMTPSPTTMTDPALEMPSAPARISRISSRRAATIDANEAARRLGQAQLKRQQGLAPLPGEQVQDSDRSAVKHRYWRRQERLRLAVEEAQRRLNETRRLQLARR